MADGGFRELLVTLGKLLFEAIVAAVKSSRHRESLPERMDTDTAAFKELELALEAGSVIIDCLISLLETLVYAESNGEEVIRLDRCIHRHELSNYLVSPANKFIPLNKQIPIISLEFGIYDLCQS